MSSGIVIFLTPIIFPLTTSLFCLLNSLKALENNKENNDIITIRNASISTLILTCIFGIVFAITAFNFKKVKSFKVRLLIGFAVLILAILTSSYICWRQCNIVLQRMSNKNIETARKSNIGTFVLNVIYLIIVVGLIYNK